MIVQSGILSWIPSWLVSWIFFFLFREQISFTLKRKYEHWYWNYFVSLNIFSVLSNLWFVLLSKCSVTEQNYFSNKLSQVGVFKQVELCFKSKVLMNQQNTTLNSENKAFLKFEALFLYLKIRRLKIQQIF